MRTRFLATEHAVRPLDSVRLPPPHIPPPDLPPFSADFVQSFNDVAVFSVSLEIDKLPIDDALSIFLSDVLPHFVDVADHEERGIASSMENLEVTFTVIFVSFGIAFCFDDFAALGSNARC